MHEHTWRRNRHPDGAPWACYCGRAAYVVEGLRSLADRADMQAHVAQLERRIAAYAAGLPAQPGDVHRRGRPSAA